MDKKKIVSYLPFVALGLSVLAIIMLFLPGVVMKEDTDYTYSAFQLAFGAKEEAMGQKIGVLAFSIIGLLKVLLPIAAAGLIAWNLFGKKPNQLFTIIAAVCLALAAIFFFCSLGLATVAKDYKDMMDEFGAEKSDIFKLGAGAIIGGIVSLLGAIATIAPVVLEKIEK